MAIKWDVRSDERAMILCIVRRALATPGLGLGKKLAEEVEMDLIAVHRNIVPLRLRELAEADDFNFVHDIGGIRRHLNRETCQLERHFLPRFSTKRRRARA